MSTWRAITEDDVRAALSSPEDSAYREQLLADGQEDPLVRILSQVTLLVRNAIRSCSKNRLHEDATFLPEGAIYHAVAIARFRLLSRFAVGEQDQASAMRKAEYDEAMAWLKLVRRCEEIIESPDGDGTDTSTPMIDVRSCNERQATRQKLSGL